MSKKIKTTKKLRLDELIKYVWENSEYVFRKHGWMSFYTNDNRYVTFTDNGFYMSTNMFEVYDLFEVEIEEEITEDTIFERCVVFLENGAIYAPTRFNIKFIKEFYKEPIKVYAVINENLELIWECEG